jgi:hypothetical protein
MRFDLLMSKVSDLDPCEGTGRSHQALKELPRQCRHSWQFNPRQKLERSPAAG